ncbi:sugar ABC transporter ATP-binding protein [Microbacterium limosum]|uniref:Sugar ABC transporter ATP-binding protein n=1 Tax=Microbacterium limosum TaxID=3079935 RepID=A0AAU0MHH2_9MICO|nr:sugar ABC transporter ATP-binding protein [Microbacterium sp. Y20]WOQ70055.1 sugar ABC transporter ATP-binding protein [Microbacterium sp. Y20]
MSEAMPLLEARDLVKTFPGVRALDGVSLRAYRGEVHALLGENGAGKSTLLKALFGAHRPDSGTILVDGEPVAFAAPSDAIQRGIAMVHQELSLVPQLDAVHNVVLGREDARAGVISWRKARKEALPALAKLGFTASPSTPVGRLSVAQQQLVELARAVATGARLIIMDEPTASLTTHESDQLFAVIRQLRDQGVAIVYVSHRLPEVLDLADRVTVLRDGSTVAELERSAVDGESHLVRLMVGRELDAIGLPRTREPGEVYLEVDELSVPGMVHDVSLAVRRGEIVGMAGMVGAGRSEFALGLIGALPSHARGVRIGGRPRVIRNPGQAIAAGIAYLPEDRKHQGLDLKLSIASNVTLPDPPGVLGLLDRRKQREVAARVMADLGSKTAVRAAAGSLSGGNQQKIVVGRWLLRDSDVYIFDEPTRGIDVGAKGEIHRLMRGLADQGKAIIMISSDLPEVLGMSDRILVMRRGCIVADVSRADATEEVIVAHAAG